MRTLLKVCIIVSLLAAAHSSLAVVDYHSLSDLVRNSPIIARGVMSVEGDAAYLNVTKTLKGEGYRRLPVKSHVWVRMETPPAHFSEGEEVLLFLETPDANGVAYLAYWGDQAKWPKASILRSPPTYAYPEILKTARVDQIQDVVEGLIRLDGTPQLEAKVKLWRECIRSSDPLRQFATMDYAFEDDHLWRVPRLANGGMSGENTDRRRALMRGLSRDVLAMALVDSNQPEVRALAIRFITYARAEQTMPYLIRSITDDDQRVRNATWTGLQTIRRELSMREFFTDYKPGDTLEQLKLTQRLWTDWWEANKDRVTKRQKPDDPNDLKLGEWPQVPQ